MAGVLSQQVNLLNIALEGLMLAGAFFAVVIGAYFGSAWVGLLAAMLFAFLFALIFGFFIIDLKANLIVAGLALNILAIGITSYLLVIWFNARGVYSPGNFEKLREMCSQGKEYWYMSPGWQYYSPVYCYIERH
jgi:simple sugar transport system permease protein